MNWTPEQRAVIDHPLDAHAVVRAVPGAGKTTTLVGRVARLCERGVDPARIRVVMFNKSIQEHFVARLAATGVPTSGGVGSGGVRVTTFDALGREVLTVAMRKGLTRRLEFDVEGTTKWARAVWPRHRDRFDTADEIAAAVAFWKAHLVSPGRAAFPSEPALVEAYREVEALRVSGDLVRVAFEDMVRTAVGVLGQHPRLLGPIDHVLVDEFQDVNPGRVELIRRLAHPGTAILAVGDEDQGVNEWCGAHPRYFRDFADTFPWLPTRTYPLTRSFRFGAAVAAAANGVIGHNVERAAVRVVGGGQTPGVVREVEDVADAVLKLLAEGWAAYEVAVLYRGRTQGAAALAALAAAGVPMRTDDISLLTRGRGPELALAYLRYATSDAPVTFDEVWPVVWAPDRYIQKEAFGKQVAKHGGRGLLAVLRDRSLAAELGQGRGALNALTELARLLESMGRASTAGVALDRLLAEVDVEAQLRARLRAEKDQELAIATFHAVHALLRGLKVRPAEAAGALENLDPTFNRRADECVWASTIHKAKGLEWRCVVLPGLIEGACPAERRGHVAGTLEEPDGVAQSPWIEQERRIFYVGLTRAIDQVLLHAPTDSPSRFVAETKGAAWRPPAAVPSVREVTEAMVRRVLREAPALEAPAASGKAWNDDEDDDLAQGWADGDTVDALATAVGRSASAVAARLVRLGLVADRGEARRRG
ncbi:MAG: ATP-dependent helicase [Pseudomonadota bacterium]|nr:ATP-dependent helicase [Pseudomonadota bacterium]